MQYTTQHSGYPGALLFFQENGGQFIPRKRKDGTSTVVLGKSVHTFWEPDSTSYHKCKAAAISFGFPHEHFTPGRLAKFILKEVCKLEPKGTEPDRKIIQLAKDGFHWHYTHVIPGYHPYLLEFDLCSAYATSLASQESFFFNQFAAVPSDGGSLANFRALMPSLPKWLRMIILGTIASHRMTFGVMPNRASGDFKIIWKTIHKIDYGAAFNQVHRAILRVYRVMRRIHEIGDIHIKRMHTDSFALSGDCPTQVESDIFDYLANQGFEVACKAQGTSHFLDLNSGIIGRKFIGVPLEIRTVLSAQKLKPKRYYLDNHSAALWEHRGIQADTERKGQPFSTLTGEQLNLDIIVREDDRAYKRDTQGYKKTG